MEKTTERTYLIGRETSVKQTKAKKVVGWSRNFGFWRPRIIGTGEVTKILNEKLRNHYSFEKKENLTKRLETAIELAKENKVLPVQDKHISFNENGHLRISGFSKWNELNSITRQRAIEEINELKDTYAHWLGLTPILRDLNGWLRPEFELNYSDGKNRIGICKVHEDRVDWMLK